MSKDERKELRALVRSFAVQSLADGTCRVHPQWIPEPIEDNFPPVGFPTRMWLAEKIEELLNAELQG